MLPTEYQEGFDVKKAYEGALAADVAKDLFLGFADASINGLRSENAQQRRLIAHLTSRLQQSEWVRRELDNKNYELTQDLLAQEAGVRALRQEIAQLTEELAAYQNGLEFTIKAAHELLEYLQESK